MVRRMLLLISLFILSCKAAKVEDPPKYIANPFRPEVDAFLMMPTQAAGRSVVIRLINKLPDPVAFDYVVSVNSLEIGSGSVALPSADPVDLAFMPSERYSAKDSFYLSLYRNKNLIWHTKL